MNRRDATTALLAGASGLTTSLLALPAWAQAAAPAEGKDFKRLDPAQPAAAPGKVEVLEFFSYGCPACNAFEPLLNSWAAKLPADVWFKRVPVPFLANAANFQRTYYALESLKLVDTLHVRVFQAVHGERQRLDRAEDIASLVGKNGGDAAKFLAAFNSFSVATSASRARKLTEDYRVESIPTLAIGGRFVTSPAQAGGAPQVLAVASALIQRARSA